MVDAARQSLFLKLRVAQRRPRLAPFFKRLGFAPVRGLNGVEFAIGAVDAALLHAPCAVRVERTNRTHDVEVRVGDAAILVRMVDGEVRNHAARDEVVQQEFTCEGDVLVERELILKRDVEAVSELRVPVALGVLDGVPERLPVGVLARRMRREQDFRVNHAAFARVVADQPVILAVELLARAVCGALNRRPPGAALYLPDVEVVERQSLTGLWQYSFHFGQVEDALHKLIKLALAHALDHRRNVFDYSSLNNKPERTFLALAVLEILNLLLDALVFMFLLAQLLFKLGALFK